MPKAPSSIPDVKADPYEKPSPSKQKASGAKGVSWTEDMDEQVIRHVLTKSDINLRYDFNELQKTAFPHLTPTQVIQKSVVALWSPSADRTM